MIDITTERVRVIWVAHSLKLHILAHGGHRFSLMMDDAPPPVATPLGFVRLRQDWFPNVPVEGESGCDPRDPGGKQRNSSASGPGHSNSSSRLHQLASCPRNLRPKITARPRRAVLRRPA